MKKDYLSKNNKGITLIALVITIIVLLILAAIVLNALLGENGIMNRAGKAKELYNESAVIEYISLKIAGATDDTYKTMLEKLQGIEDIEIEQAGEDAYHVTKDGYTITIYENGEMIEGTVDIWDDTSVDVPQFDNEFNWYIYNCAQLKFLADFVNNGNALTEEQKTIVQNGGYNESDVTIDSETIVYLMNDLDLGARFDENGELISGTQWIPIGNSDETDFIGSFEGNNHTISRLYIKQENSLLGLFGYANEVRNLTVKNGYIEGTNTQIGSIAGAANILKNCHNKNTSIKATSSAGGIVGEACIVENCTNTGTVIGNRRSGYVGGIVGMSVLYGDAVPQVSSCTNYGKVYGSFSIMGGIVGIHAAGSITDCVNYGEIGDSEVRCVSGISADLRATMKNCVNHGKIIGKEQVARNSCKYEFWKYRKLC